MGQLLKRSFTAVLCALLLPGGGWIYAQNRNISGTVTDENGEAVIGAGVVVVGQSTIGTTTDLDGTYTLSVPAGATALDFSCIGYDDKRVEIGTSSVIDVVLEANNFIEETVVIGYGVQKKSDLTGAVASVRSEDLQNRSTSDAASALQGKAAGVQILTGSGAPGEGAEIRVRGFSSNSGNLGPLLIVDGLQVDNIQYLDPEMIESIEVLKDAASAAIYGAQAGNGVVLVTTKSGARSHDGEGSVFYNTQFSLSSLSRKLDIMNAQEYIDFGLAQGFLSQTLLDTYYDGHTDVNWGDEVFEPTWNQRHTVGFQGGNDRGNYFASINYVDNDGIFAGDKDTYNRLTFQVNASYKIKKWLTVGTNNSIEKWGTKSISQRNDNGSAMLAAITSSPLFPVRVDYDGLTPAMQDALARGVKVLQDPETGLYWGLPLIGETQSANPFIQRDNSDSSSGGISIRGVAYANINPFDGFTFTSRFGYRISQSTSHNYSEPYYANAFVKSDVYSISANANTSHYYQWENFINYDKSFGKHDVTAMVGMSFIENNYDNVSASASGADILRNYAENFRYINYLKSGNDVTRNMGNAPGRSAQLSYFGRLGYTYDDRYSVQANFRADAYDSSKLPAESRWGFFPSFSAGWTISNERFIKDNVSSDILSFLKVRASWGLNGNINVLSGYPYSTTINVNGMSYQYDVMDPALSYGSMPSGLANPDLRWETSEQLDLGLDARLFDDRLVFAMDYYRKDTRDLLVGVRPVSEVGVSGSQITNAGSIRNSGLEFELSWRDQIGDFSYSVAANMSTLKNVVTYLDPSIDRLSGRTPQGTRLTTTFEEGYPIWYMLGFVAEGIDENGLAILKDTDNNGVIDDLDRVNIGCGIPDLTYGITINLAWKGIDFTVFGTGVSGNEIYPTSFRTDRPSCNTYSYYWNNSWKEGQDNSNAKFPSATNWSQEAFSSTLAVFDGSYFKIKQVQLGYTLPRQWTERVKISRLRIFASLENYFTFTKYIGLDPETAASGGSSSGIDMGTYPTAKQFILGLNLSF